MRGDEGEQGDEGEGAAYVLTAFWRSYKGLENFKKPTTSR